MVAIFFNERVFHLVIFQAVLLVIVLSNIWITRRARLRPPPQEFPMVSVLIPARNEERNIGECIRSLLAQDFPNFEVLVLDDQSNDGTLEVLKRIAASQPQLQVIQGQPTPENFMGKNWACTQLAEQARGDLLLFTDADTRHRPEMLRSVVTAMIGSKADLLTGHPRQVVHSWGERLLVPFFSWAMFSFIPLALSYRLHLPGLSSAVGQLMLFRREAYQAIGGHAGVHDSVVDDISLTRRIISARLRWRVVHIADLISCRMYHSGREAVDGFTKNLFAVFDQRLLPFLVAYLWLLVMFWKPLVVLVLVMTGQASQSLLADIATCMALALLLWSIHYINLRIPIGLAFLYPITILANVSVALRSCIYSLGGHSEWKGRKITRSRWKLL